jgi:hypothetical protein
MRIFNNLLLLTVLTLVCACQSNTDCDGDNPDLSLCVTGCTDPDAINYNADAEISGHCNYFNRPASILFSVPDSIGGPLNVYVESNDYSIGSPSVTVSHYGALDCDNIVEDQLIKIGRNLSSDQPDEWSISYFANDSIGNEIEGTLNIRDGECYSVVIPRENPGRVLFYARDFSSVLVELLFTGWLDGTEADASIYFNNNPSPTDCESEYTFELPVGTYRWKASENGMGDLDLYEGTFEITSGSCEIISLKN